MEFHHICRMGNATICHLGDMDETILMDTDIHEDTEVGDVGHDARQDHALYEIIDGRDILIELKLLNLFARIATWFLQFLHDIRQGGDAYVSCDITFDINGLALLLILNKVSYRTTLILRHLFYNGIALWMNG